MFDAFVYMLASRRNGTLYIGVTSNLPKRIHEHRTDAVEGFTSRHNVKMLVWYEAHDSIQGAIWREKALKKWRRAWKLQLIEQANPAWRDLYDDIAGP
ncbi:GIY-YIG nuclease family protein [Emcibacter sp. SYSU 3D8]|uniref:GIY-YIG nuclease family protein n=1 Tax=Emcibacter sp. SYSU 3D8 TaxID=3133969 RepID=UPI0031FF0F12